MIACALIPRGALSLLYRAPAPSHDGGHDRKTWTAAELRAELAKYHQKLIAAGNHRPSTITTYVQHPERFIAYLEGTYDPRQPQGRNAR
jgi:hypothetical protein